MRRIFGAAQPGGEASIARSDSSHSDRTSDKLASPVLEGQNTGSRGPDSTRRWFASGRGQPHPESPDSLAQPRASTDSAAAGSSGTFPDLDRLPFARTLSPSASSTASLSRLATGDAVHHVGSPAASEAGGRSSQQMNSGKDAMMVELLSGEAVIEAANYEVLPRDERQAMKKEHAALVSRLAALKRSVAVETRLRDSAAKLVRLSAPEEAQAPISAAAPPRPRVTRQQAEAQLAVAQQKLDTAEHALTQVSTREAELHARLLAHTAGVLSLALRNRDTAEADAKRFSSAARLSTSSHTFADHAASATKAATSAADAERIQSLERDLSSEAAKSSTLEQRLADLERALDQTKQQARADFEGLRSELTRAQQATASTEEAATHRIGELESEVEHLRNELEHATTETDHLRGQLAAAPSDARRQEKDVLEQDLEHARGEVKQLTDELEEAQEELHSLQRVFDKRLRAAEESGTKRAAEAGASAQDRHREMTEALGDVLRRHRTRPTLGPALRELPSFDDTSDRNDLAEYLASTLDSHFDRISTHVLGLNDEISALSHERDSAETELEVLRSQADDAATSRAALTAQEEDLAASRREHQVAQSDLSEAQSRLAELEKQLQEVATERVELQQLWQVLPAGADQATSYTTASLVGRARALLEQHRGLSERVGAHEREQQSAASTAASGREADAARIRELEERVDVSSQKEVTMLERLNDLTESLEATRAERRKLENRLAPLEAEKARLETELSAARSPPTTSKSLPAAPSTPAAGDAPGAGASEGELQELRDQITDLEEELADSQKREQRTRASLLEELATVQSEVSALKTQLRQAQRKLGGRT